MAIAQPIKSDKTLAVLVEHLEIHQNLIVMNARLQESAANVFGSVPIAKRA